MLRPRVAGYAAALIWGISLLVGLDQFMGIFPWPLRSFSALSPVRRIASTLGLSQSGGWPTFIGDTPDAFQLQLRTWHFSQEVSTESVEILVPYRQGPIRDLRAYFLRSLQSWTLDGYVREGILRHECRKRAPNGTLIQKVQIEAATLRMRDYLTTGGHWSPTEFKAYSIYDCARDQYISAGKI